jgi:GTP-binding protein Era
MGYDMPIEKSGFVTIIGRPNVGKSTLMNQLIGQKIAITSPKPQTTRNRIRTILTLEDAQIVFVDTPGIHTSKNKLGDYMVQSAKQTLSQVDLILWLVEASEQFTIAQQTILDLLRKVDTPVFLVINKIDLLKEKGKLLPMIERYQQEFDFSQILPLSALKGDGTKELLDAILQVLPEGPAFFDEDTITDQPIRQIAAELVREKALYLLQEEIPHGIAVIIESMKSSRASAAIEATIICEKNSHKGMIIGKGGTMLKRIGSLARPEIERILDKRVHLQLFVKVKKDWRDSDFLLKNFGYDSKEIDLS